MEKIKTPIEDLWLINQKVFKDPRGFFMEHYNKKSFQEIGIEMDFVQDNLSYSAPGTLRGLHYQEGPAQAKLVGVLQGKVWDVAVDLRKDSKTYKQHFGVELSADSPQLFLIPEGFAHGFCVLGEEPAMMFYKTNNFYNAAGDKGVLWNDPELKIPWPIESPLLSDKDQKLPSLS